VGLYSICLILGVRTVAAFTDHQGHAWIAIVTAGMLKRLKAVDLDLATIVQRDPAKLADPDTLGRILWILCEPHKPEHGSLSEEAFADRFDGDTFHAAIEAVMEAFVDFSHAASTRQAARQTMRRAMVAAEQDVIRRMASAQFSTDVTNSPVPSGSGPTSSASPN
jgi:hypothetical protein